MAQPTAVQMHTPQVPSAITSHIANYMPEVKTLIPPDIGIEAFRAALWAHLKEIPKLAEATPESIAKSVVKMALHGYLPGRDAYILVFGRKAECVVDYKGLIRTLMRTGHVAKAMAEVVYKKELPLFKIDYGRDYMEHVPWLEDDPGPVVGAYAQIFLKDSTKHFRFMRMTDLERVRAVALGRDQDAWVKHPTEMYRKTALKNLCKYVQLPVTVEEAIALDEGREEEPDVIITNGRKAAEELFGGVHEETPPPPVREDLQYYWDLAACGGSGAEATERRTTLLVLVTGMAKNAVSGPEALDGADWETCGPLLEHMCARVTAGDFHDVKTRRELNEKLQQAKTDWIMEHSPSTT